MPVRDVTLSTRASAPSLVLRHVTTATPVAIAPPQLELRAARPLIRITVREAI